jgi:hypothetical protein
MKEVDNMVITLLDEMQYFARQLNERIVIHWELEVKYERLATQAIQDGNVEEWNFNKEMSYNFRSKASILEEELKKLQTILERFE